MINITIKAHNIYNIVNCTHFNQNRKKERQCRCLERLSELIRSHNGDTFSPAKTELALTVASIAWAGQDIRFICVAHFINIL